MYLSLILFLPLQSNQRGKICAHCSENNLTNQILVDRFLIVYSLNS
ncbi:hypothetical protein X975_15396, partial [Stegodyphus mimosarum]